jgi:hypothetical protein
MGFVVRDIEKATVIETAELTPTRRRIFEAVREAAVDWDGNDPIRHDWPAG